MMATAPPHDSTKVRTVIIPTESSDQQDFYSQPKDAKRAPGTSESSSSQEAVEAAPTNRHAEFYFTDEMTVFQVESRLFRVHRHFLAENSLIFSSMFSLPRGAQVSSTAAEGTSDSNPIFLAGVTELEFETLLRFFYKSIYDDFSLSQESWVALLSIAHRFEFLNVRDRAIREIYGPFRARQKRWDSMTNTERKEQEMQQELQQHDYQQLLVVAEKYDVPLRYIVPLLLPFVVREQPMTEAEVLGFSALTVSRLAHAREDFQRERGSQGWRVTFPDAKEIVYRIWQVQTDG